MSGTYKAIGINLKSTPLGESDRLLTVLTEEFGLIRVVAPGARKHRSSLGGRSSLFVVNQLLIAKGKSLDKIVQAETLESYPGLSQDLGKLTASQYLAELTLCQALSDQPQTELFCLLQEHLSHLEALPAAAALACLTHATFHLLALAGLAPQVQTCCVTQEPVAPDFSDPDWRIGFSVVAGGTVNYSELERFSADSAPKQKPIASSSPGSYAASTRSSAASTSQLCAQLTATELHLLQRLVQPDLIQLLSKTDEPLLYPCDRQIWLPIERILRHYAQYHFDRPIRSATLIDTCFAPAVAPSLVYKP
jgi:DNA repair protein RecO (recombination protein O)